MELSTIIKALNEFIKEYGVYKESWGLKNGDNTKKCGPENNDDDVEASTTNPIKFHLSSCLPNDRDWIQNLDENDADPTKKEKIKGIKNYATLISDMAVMVKNLDGNYKHT